MLQYLRDVFAIKRWLTLAREICWSDKKIQHSDTVQYCIYSILLTMCICN